MLWAFWIVTVTRNKNSLTQHHEYPQHVAKVKFIFFDVAKGASKAIIRTFTCRCIVARVKVSLHLLFVI